jgi:hypothetical protein
MIDHLPTGAADPHYWDKVDIEKNLMLLKGWKALGASDSAARARRNAAAIAVEPYSASVTAGFFPRRVFAYRRPVPPKDRRLYDKRDERQIT